MRTTLNLDDHLMRALKKRAAETGRTITRVIEDALRDSLARERARRHEPFKLRWVTVRGRVQPGVDLTDRHNLLDRMDGRA